MVLKLQQNIKKFWSKKKHETKQNFWLKTTTEQKKSSPYPIKLLESELQVSLNVHILVNIYCEMLSLDFLLRTRCLAKT